VYHPSSESTRVGWAWLARAVSSAAALFLLLLAPGRSAGASAPLIDSAFDTGAEGFLYGDDVFRSTNQPRYARGSYEPAGGYSGGGLKVTVGGVDSVDILNGMSGGWSHSFSLAKF